MYITLHILRTLTTYFTYITRVFNYISGIYHSITWRVRVDQKLKIVLFYVETKSVVATQKRFRAHFGTRWAPCKQAIYRLSLGKFSTL